MRISNNTLPYGYGIGKVQKVTKTHTEINKDREKQNEEKKENLYKQKCFLEYLRESEKNSNQNQPEKINRKRKYL